MIGYLDLPSGLSGDMFLGCLVDAGWEVDRLRATTNCLGLPTDQWSVDAQTVMKGPLKATWVEVKVEESHHHRHLSEVCRMIEAADLPSPVQQGAVAVFVRLAEAEAKVHGTTPEKIHFHEVGALDAIIDVVGAVAGLHDLGIRKLYASAPPLSDGWVETEHGRLPLPAPATLELLSSVNAPTRPGPGPGEWVTPTGAALLAELATFNQPPMRLDRIGLGAGRRDTDWPNVARLWIGQPIDESQLVQMETNIDDMNPQLYAAVVERLFAAGALDVWLTPVQMKKGRPAVVLSVLTSVGREEVLADLILRETTTLGLRVFPVRRHEARRETREVDTPYGAVAVKLKWVGRELIGATPEYDRCKALADSAQVTVREVYEAALSAGRLLVDEATQQAHVDAP